MMYTTSFYDLVSLPQDNMLNILRKNMSLQMFLVSNYPHDINLNYCSCGCVAGHATSIGARWTLKHMT